MAEDIIRSEENVDVEGIGSRISDDIGRIIEHSKHAVAVYLNRIGRCIANELDAISDEKYGSKIVSTVSRQLTERFGKGYQRANLFRMLKVARVFPDEETVSTLSRQLTWSHFVELSDGRGTGSWHKERGDGRNDVRWMMAEVCGERVDFPLRSSS